MFEKKTKHPLSDIKIFDNIDPSEKDFHIDKFYQLSFVADDIITSGHCIEQKVCYFIISGSVRVVHSIPKTTETCYYELEDTYGFCFDGLFMDGCKNNQNKSHIIVSANENVRLMAIKKEDLEKILNCNEIMKNFTRFLIEMNRKIVLPSEDAVNVFRKRVNS